MATRRTPEQLIKDLEAQIEQVKRRAAQRKAKKDPTLRHIAGAVRAIDKALAVTKDAATRSALGEARSALTAVLALSGVVPASTGAGKAAGKAKPGAKVAPDAVLDYVKKHPGGRSEDIAEALGTSTAGLRPALQQLKSGGKVVTKGKARATRYFAGSGK